MTDPDSTDGERVAAADSGVGSEDWADLIDGTYLRRYRSELRESIDEPPVAGAFDSWRRYVRRHHGDVAEELASADGRTDSLRSLFVETLAFDYRLLAVLEAIQTHVECEVIRPLAAGASVPYAPDFESVHDHVSSRIEAPKRARAAFENHAQQFARSAGPEAVARLHRASVSLPFRRAFGRYDTPYGLAELAVDEAMPRSVDSTGPASAPDASLPIVLDPGCGAGTFLAAATRELVERIGADSPPSGSGTGDDSLSGERIRTIVDSVRGFDVSPTAVRASRLAVALAIRPLLADRPGRREAADAETPTFAPRVVLGDAVETAADDQPLGGRRADVVLANPPWLTWDRLSEGTKSRWRDGPIADPSLELFVRDGADARLGYANDDLSVPYAWTCLDRLLRDGGRAAVVLKRDVLTGVAGERARRRDLGDRDVVHEHVHDFGDLAPFPAVDAGTALFSLRVGDRAADRSDRSAGRSEPDPPDGDTVDGVPATGWDRRDDAGATASGARGRGLFGSLARMRDGLDRSATHLVPADPDDPTSPWIRADAERRALGGSAYRIRHGVKDDAKSVYAVDRETIERHDLEPDHVFPYLKSRHIVKYGLFGYDRHLVPQRKAGEDNAAALRRDTPATYAYLEAHRDRLLDRGSTWFDDGPFYSLFGLGPYTWADYKVVWCRLGFKPHFAVVSTVTDPILGEKPVVPGDHCMFVGTDDEREAFYLCGLLNSAPYQRCLRDVASGGKSSLSKSTVERLALPAWSGRRQQRRLADLAERAHGIVPEHVDCSKRAYNRKTIPELTTVQASIDRVAERFLTDVEDRTPSEID